MINTNTYYAEHGNTICMYHHHTKSNYAVNTVCEERHCKPVCCHRIESEANAARACGLIFVLLEFGIGERRSWRTPRLEMMTCHGSDHLVIKCSPDAAMRSIYSTNCVVYMYSGTS